ncbi:MAG: hypothetical protein UV78_C0057G0002 [Parcubacteria group bacterium GW2011_GWA2_43_17]|nr:MAG: hypothetical protein UV78_C0057G0002 [Parcubacteria group bacterium GW2011_GWA2_43_17]OHB45083.1 MAG: hypothetical protein A2Y13_04530 [Planctomycetes bacterium GWC2_45_44]
MIKAREYSIQLFFVLSSFLLIMLTSYNLVLAKTMDFNTPQNNITEMSEPNTHIFLGGETGKRIDAILRNWILRAPKVNPGMIEMFRLRDRHPPYVNPTMWAGEFVGKYLISAIQFRHMIDSPELEKLIREVIGELISTQAENGYCGPFPKEHGRLVGHHWDVWGHYHIMQALYMWYRETGDRASLDAALKAADLICTTYLNPEQNFRDTNWPEMNMAVIHVLGMLYRETGKEDYYQLMKKIEKEWQEPGAGDYYNQAMKGVDFYLTPKPRWESLHTMQGLGELYRISGNESYKQALLHYWYSIRKTDVHNSGSFSTSESAIGSSFEAGPIETCCTVAWLAYSIDALRLSGDSVIADAIELATWNAVLGYQHPSGSWCTYDTPMDGKREASITRLFDHERPGTPELNCCSVNGPRGLGMISEWAVLNDSNGIYLNYYGPCTMDIKLNNGVNWKFTQITQYPVNGDIRIEITPKQPTEATIYLRIPKWSKETTVSVNAGPALQVAAGYYPVKRIWKKGDIVELSFDMSIHALRGDQNVAYNTSLYKGPLLLAFDQKHNTLEPDQVPMLDLNNLELIPAHCDALFQSMVLFKSRAIDGQEIYLTDFATAGAHGTAYRSWLPVKNAPPSQFKLVSPQNGKALPADDLYMQWSSAAPGTTYDFLLAEDEKFSKVVLCRQNITDIGVDIDVSGPNTLTPNKTYYWDVKLHTEKQSHTSVNGPWSFQVDPTVQSIRKGTVFRASLAGDAIAAEGKLLEESNTTPIIGREGEEKGALFFNGSDSKVIYAAPFFPTKNYTFGAWFCCKDLTKEDGRLHQIFSAWYQSNNDAIRVAVKNMKLFVSIEQRQGLFITKEVSVENDKWTHVAVVKKGSELCFYVNGCQIHCIVVPEFLFSTPPNLGIGCNPNLAGEGFRGSISDVFFCREAMTSEEVQSLYNNKK